MREERESYRITSVPFTLQAAYEPALFHTVEDHDDIEDDIERIPMHHMQVSVLVFKSICWNSPKFNGHFHLIGCSMFLPIESDHRLIGDHKPTRK